MSGSGHGHIEEGDFLRYVDGELGQAETRRVKDHLASCWQCRSELAEVERTIDRCVKYRSQVLHERLPDPPRSWMDIDARLVELEAKLTDRPWYARIGQALAGVPVPRLAAAVATIVAASLVFQQLRQTPVVQAAELLDRAVTANAHWEKGRGAMLVRSGGEKRTAIDGELALRFAEAQYDAADPLNPRSYVAWRRTLAEKSDEVVQVRDRAGETTAFRVKTTAPGAVLEQATLELAAVNLRPVEAAFVFRGYPVVEIRETEVVLPPAVAAIEPRPMSPAAAVPAAETPVVEAPASAADELQVLAVLRRLEADLGEPIEVRRGGPKVVVSGAGLEPDLASRLRRELAALPRVSLELVEPGTAPTLSAERRAAPAAAASPAALALRAELEKRAGGAMEFQQFTDEMLAGCDAILARAHALRRLSSSVSPSEETALDAGHRALLYQIREEHAKVARRRIEDLRRAVAPLMGEVPTEAGIQPGTWQRSAAEVFQKAQRLDTAVAAMLGEAGNESDPGRLPAEILTLLAQLQVSASGLK